MKVFLCVVMLQALTLGSVCSVPVNEEVERRLLRSDPGTAGRSVPRVLEDAGETEQEQAVCGTITCPKFASCVSFLESGEEKCECLISDGAKSDGGQGCVDVNECINDSGSTNVCPLQGGYCVDHDPPMKYQCGCLPGWKLTAVDPFFGATDCVDLNECTEGLDGSGQSPCSPFAICENLPGSYNCTCDNGYKGDGLDCVIVSQEEISPSSCTTSADCGDFATCTTEQVCVCEVGYFDGKTTQADFANKIECRNRNECTTSKHDCDRREQGTHCPRASCIDTLPTDDPAFYTCACEEELGWIDDPGSLLSNGPGRNCVNRNECVDPPMCNEVWSCGVNGICVDGYCTCEEDYICVDLVPCAGMYECMLDPCVNNTCSENEICNSNSGDCQCGSISSGNQDGGLTDACRGNTPLCDIFPGKSTLSCGCNDDSSCGPLQICTNNACTTRPQVVVPSTATPTASPSPTTTQPMVVVAPSTATPTTATPTTATPTTSPSPTTTLSPTVSPFPTISRAVLSQVITCIAVIDESDNVGSFEALWQEFRTRYPDRPFCLLQPEGSFVTVSDLKIPADFLTDGNTIFSVVSREFNDVSMRSDYFNICNLGGLRAQGITEVAIFIDNSGSLTTSMVQPSIDLLNERIAQEGLQLVAGIENFLEDWVTPFLTDF